MNTHADKQFCPSLRKNAFQSSYSIFRAGSYAHGLGLYKPRESYPLRYCQLMDADDKKLLCFLSPHRDSAVFHRFKQHYPMVASATMVNSAVHVPHAGCSLRRTGQGNAHYAVLAQLSLASPFLPFLPSEVSHA